MSSLEKCHTSRKGIMQGHRKYSDGFSDTSSVGSFIDDTDREVSNLTDRAFRSLCIGEEAIYNDSDFSSSPTGRHKAFVEETQDGEILKGTAHETLSCSVQQGWSEVATAFQHSFMDVAQQEQAQRAERLSYLSNGAAEMTWHQRRSTSRVSSLIKAFSAGEGYGDPGLSADAVAVRDKYRDVNSESWDGSALLSIQRELSEFSSDYHQNFKSGPFRAYRDHCMHASNVAAAVAQVDTTSYFMKSSKSKHSKSSTFKALNSTNFFLHSEFSPFQVWNDYNRFPFERRHVSGFMSASEFPRWYDSPLYKELTAAQSRIQSSPLEGRRLHRKPIEDVVPTQRSRSTVVQKASAIEKRCESEVTANCPPWRRSNSLVRSKLPTNRPSTVSPTSEKSRRPDSSLFSVSRATEVQQQVNKVVDEQLPSSVTPFNITQLPAHARQETETSEILQFALSPPAPDVPTQSETDPKSLPDAKQLRDSYRTRASSLLFNLKDNRKRVKSTYSPTKFKGLEITDRNKQPSKLEGLEPRISSALSEISVSQVTMQECPPATDTQSPCNPTQLPTAAPTAHTVEHNEYTAASGSHGYLTFSSTQAEAANYVGLSGVSQGSSHSQGQLTNRESGRYDILPSVPSTREEISGKRSENSSYDTYRAASPKTQGMKNTLPNVKSPPPSLTMTEKHNVRKEVIAAYQNEVIKRETIASKPNIEHSLNELTGEKYTWNQRTQVNSRTKETFSLNDISKAETLPIKGEIAALIEMDKQRKAAGKQDPLSTNVSYNGAKEPNSKRDNEKFQQGLLAKQAQEHAREVLTYKASHADKAGLLNNLPKRESRSNTPNRYAPKNDFANKVNDQIVRDRFARNENTHLKTMDLYGDQKNDQLSKKYQKETNDTRRDLVPDNSGHDQDKETGFSEKDVKYAKSEIANKEEPSLRKPYAPVMEDKRPKIEGSLCYQPYRYEPGKQWHMASTNENKRNKSEISTLPQPEQSKERSEQSVTKSNGYPTSNASSTSKQNMMETTKGNQNVLAEDRLIAGQNSGGEFKHNQSDTLTTKQKYDTNSEVSAKEASIPKNVEPAKFSLWSMKEDRFSINDILTIRDYEQTKRERVKENKYGFSDVIPPKEEKTSQDASETVQSRTVQSDVLAASGTKTEAFTGKEHEHTAKDVFPSTNRLESAKTASLTTRKDTCEQNEAFARRENEMSKNTDAERKDKPAHNTYLNKETDKISQRALSYEERGQTKQKISQRALSYEERRQTKQEILTSKVKAHAQKEISAIREKGLAKQGLLARHPPKLEAHVDKEQGPDGQEVQQVRKEITADKLNHLFKDIIYASGAKHEEIKNTDTDNLKEKSLTSEEIKQHESTTNNHQDTEQAAASVLKNEPDTYGGLAVKDIVKAQPMNEKLLTQCRATVKEDNNLNKHGPWKGDKHNVQQPAPSVEKRFSDSKYHREVKNDTISNNERPSSSQATLPAKTEEQTKTKPVDNYHNKKPKYDAVGNVQHNTEAPSKMEDQPKIKPVDLYSNKKAEQPSLATKAKENAKFDSEVQGGLLPVRMAAEPISVRKESPHTKHGVNVAKDKEGPTREPIINSNGVSVSQVVPPSEAKERRLTVEPASVREETDRTKSGVNTGKEKEVLKKEPIKNSDGVRVSQVLAPSNSVVFQGGVPAKRSMEDLTRGREESVHTKLGVNAAKEKERAIKAPIKNSDGVGTSLVAPPSEVKEQTNKNSVAITYNHQSSTTTKGRDNQEVSASVGHENKTNFKNVDQQLKQRDQASGEKGVATQDVSANKEATYITQTAPPSDEKDDATPGSVVVKESPLMKELKHVFREREDQTKGVLLNKDRGYGKHNSPQPKSQVTSKNEALPDQRNPPNKPGMKNESITLDGNQQPKQETVTTREDKFLGSNDQVQKEKDSTRQVAISTKERESSQGESFVTDKNNRHSDLTSKTHSGLLTQKLPKVQDEDEIVAGDKSQQTNHNLPVPSKRYDASKDELVSHSIHVASVTDDASEHEPIIYSIRVSSNSDANSKDEPVSHSIDVPSKNDNVLVDEPVIYSIHVSSKNDASSKYESVSHSIHVPSEKEDASNDEPVIYSIRVSSKNNEPLSQGSANVSQKLLSTEKLGAKDSRTVVRENKQTEKGILTTKEKDPNMQKYDMLASRNTKENEHTGQKHDAIAAKHTHEYYLARGRDLLAKYGLPVKEKGNVKQVRPSAVEQGHSDTVIKNNSTTRSKERDYVENGRQQKEIVDVVQGEHLSVDNKRSGNMSGNSAQNNKPPTPAKAEEINPNNSALVREDKDNIKQHGDASTEEEHTKHDIVTSNERGIARRDVVPTTIGPQYTVGKQSIAGNEKPNFMPVVPLAKEKVHFQSVVPVSKDAINGNNSILASKQHMGNDGSFPVRESKQVEEEVRGLGGKENVSRNAASAQDGKALAVGQKTSETGNQTISTKNPTVEKGVITMAEGTKANNNVLLNQEVVASSSSEIPVTKKIVEAKVDEPGSKETIAQDANEKTQKESTEVNLPDGRRDAFLTRDGWHPNRDITLTKNQQASCRTQQVEDRDVAKPEIPSKEPILVKEQQQRLPNSGKEHFWYEKGSQPKNESIAFSANQETKGQREGEHFRKELSNVTDKHEVKEGGEKELIKNESIVAKGRQESSRVPQFSTIENKKVPKNGTSLDRDFKKAEENQLAQHEPKSRERICVRDDAMTEHAKEKNHTQNETITTYSGHDIKQALPLVKAQENAQSETDMKKANPWKGATPPKEKESVKNKRFSVDQDDTQALPNVKAQADVLSESATKKAHQCKRVTSPQEKENVKNEILTINKDAIRAMERKASQERENINPAGQSKSISDVESVKENGENGENGETLDVQKAGNERKPVKQDVLIRKYHDHPEIALAPTTKLNGHANLSFPASKEHNTDTALERNTLMKEKVCPKPEVSTKGRRGTKPEISALADYARLRVISVQDDNINGKDALFSNVGRYHSKHTLTAPGEHKDSHREMIASEKYRESKEVSSNMANESKMEAFRFSEKGKQSLSSEGSKVAEGTAHRPDQHYSRPGIHPRQGHTKLSALATTGSDGGNSKTFDLKGKEIIKEEVLANNEQGQTKTDTVVTEQSYQNVGGQRGHRPHNPPAALALPLQVEGRRRDPSWSRQPVHVEMPKKQLYAPTMNVTQNMKQQPLTQPSLGSVVSAVDKKEDGKNVMGGGRKSTENMEHLQYYAINALESAPQPKDRLHTSPRRHETAPKNDTELPELGRDESGFAQLPVDYAKAHPTGPRSNSSSPAMGKPIMFKVKDNTLRSSSVTKAVKPRYHRSLSEDFRISSPRESWGGSEQGDEEHGQLKESADLPVFHEPALASHRISRVREMAPHNVLPSAEFTSTKEPRSQEDDDTRSIFSVMSENVESCATSTVDVTDNYRDAYDRPESACSFNDTRPLGKPPTVPPKSAKGLLRALKLTHRRIKKTEAKTPEIPESQGQLESKPIRTGASVHSQPESKPIRTGSSVHSQLESKPICTGASVHSQPESKPIRTGSSVHSQPESKPIRTGSSVHSQPESKPIRTGSSVHSQLESKPIHTGSSVHSQLESKPIRTGSSVHSQPESKPIRTGSSVHSQLESKPIHTGSSVHSQLESKPIRTGSSVHSQPESKPTRAVSSVPSSPTEILSTRRAVHASPPVSQYRIEPSYVPQAPNLVAQPYPMTQRKLLQDPNSGQYFMVDMPVPVKTKTFFDPVTGKYVQLSVRQRAPGTLSQPASMEALNHPYVLYPGFLPMSVSSLPPLRSSSQMSAPGTLAEDQGKIDVPSDPRRQEVYQQNYSREPQQYTEPMYVPHQQLGDDSLYSGKTDNTGHRDITLIDELEDFFAG